MRHAQKTAKLFFSVRVPFQIKYIIQKKNIYQPLGPQNTLLLRPFHFLSSYFFLTKIMSSNNIQVNLLRPAKAEQALNKSLLKDSKSRTTTFFHF